MLHLNIRKTIGRKARIPSVALHAVGAENLQPTPEHKNEGRRPLTAAGAATLAATLIAAITPVSRADSDRGQLTFGPPDALHVVVAGDTSAGYRAELYDANQFVTGRGLTGKYDLTVFAGTSPNQPTGPDLLTDPTAVGSWQGPFQNGVGSVPGSITMATAGSRSHRVNTTAQAPMHGTVSGPLMACRERRSRQRRRPRFSDSSLMRFQPRDRTPAMCRLRAEVLSSLTRAACII
jgi:hypothetical protein